MMREYNLKKNKYILFILLSVLFFIVFNAVNVFAKDVTPSKVTASVGAKVQITSDGCNSWKKDGTACKVTVTATPSKGIGCSKSSATATATFKSATSVKVTGNLGNSTQGTSSVSCTWGATIKTYNRDNTPPMFKSNSISLSGGVCDKSTISGSFSGNITASNTATCVGSVTATNNSLWDGQSGISSSKVSQTVSPGSSGDLVGVDKAGNVQYHDYGTTARRPLAFKINKDTTPCGSPQYSVQSPISGTKFYHRSNSVSCSGWCAAGSDNVAEGGTVTSSTGTDGTICTAKACDKAGNCHTHKYTITRDRTAPTCSVSSIQGKTINGYYLGKVTVTWKTGDGQSLLSSNAKSVDYYSKSITSNRDTYVSGNTISDRAGNNKTCDGQSIKRDQTAPTDCSYTEPSHYSNSVIKITARCTKDSGVGCSDYSFSKNYYMGGGNGTFSGDAGINVYDKTYDYSQVSGRTDANAFQCEVKVTHLDNAAPTCKTSQTVDNPVLSSDKKTWSKNTWHNAETYIYDENGNKTTNDKRRVQVKVASATDHASPKEGSASGVKAGYGGGLNPNVEAYTVIAGDNFLEIICVRLKLIYEMCFI